jgi:hypothetical protein
MLWTIFLVLLVLWILGVAAVGCASGLDISRELLFRESPETTETPGIAIPEFCHPQPDPRFRL